MPKIAHVLEAVLYVDDLPRAKKFYLQSLDLSLLHADARMRAFSAGTTVLLLFKRGEGNVPALTPGRATPGLWANY